MKSVFRKTVMAALMATVAFVPGLSTHAQGSNCYGLNADDCALAQAALNTSDATKLTSFVLEYSVSGSTTGTSSDVSFKLTGTGPLSVDTSKPGSASSVTMQNTLKGSLTASGTTTNDNADARILNGTLYLKDDLITKGAWQSLDLSTAAGTAMANPMVGGMLSGMTGGSTGSTGSTGLPSMNNPMLTALSNPDTMQSLMKALQTPGFITATRGADATSNGETFASFIYNVDIPTLLKSPDFKPAFQSIMAAQGGSSSMTDQQLNQMIVMGGSVLQGVKLTFTEYVGATDKLPHGVAINFAGHFDAATAAMLNPSSTSNTPIDIAFNLDIKLSKIGQPVSVDAVTGATPFDMSGMGMGGMMGGAATPSAQ